MSAAPPPPLSTMASRAQVVVARVLGEVALAGERTHAIVRLSVCAAIAVLWPVAASFADDKSALWSVETSVLLALAGSVVMLWLVYRQERMTPLFGLVSAIVDVAFAGCLGLAIVLAPPEDFTGLLHSTGFPILYVCVVAAGVRLSKRTAVGAGVAAVVVMLALHVLDRHENPERSLDGAAHVIIAVMLIGAATAVAATMAARSRAVALSSAQQTLMFERARSALGSYVSSEVAEQALTSDVLRLGGAHQQVTVIFTDLRSFTSKSEQADPEALVRELNEYFEHMVRVIRHEGGVVDKYIGDSIMAVFGAPVAKSDDAARGLRAAAGLVTALAELNERRADRGLPPLAHGVGVHTGDVIAGNIGTTDRVQFTVIGDAVNVAARLESATKEHGVMLLASSHTVAAAKAAGLELPALRDIGAITVKGRAQAIDVLTVA